MKLYLYNKTYFYKILSFILIICNLGSVTASAYVSLDKCDLSKNNSSITQNTDDKNHELIEKFQPVIENIFLNRNSAILTGDSEGLKLFYDLDKRVGKWTYEKEVTKTHLCKNKFSYSLFMV